VGKVIRPHGIKGLIRVWSYARSAESFLHSGTIFFKLDQKAPVECRILEVKPYKNIFLMAVEDLDSYEKADKYRGAKIFVKKDHLRQNNEDEYFWFELIGLDVYQDNGEYLGILKEIIPTGSNDVYVVRLNESEFLIPAIHEVIKKIDIEDRKMIISAMEGLLDLNEV
ncbi:ribosome maturation factor RimM, partial [Thermodesulfobacteriota bacterium]